MRLAARTPLAVLGLTGLATLLVLACTRRPDEAAFDNPFDPNGSGGDPFRVTAQVVGSNVAVGWRAAGVPGLTRYAVLRSLSATTGFGQIGEAPVTDNRPQYVFQDTGYARNRTNYYKIRAYRNAEASLDSRVAAAGVFAPPQIAILGDTLFARAATLRLRTDVGDTVEVADTNTFADSRRFVITGAAVLVPWDLAPAAGAGVKARVHARVWTAGVPGVAIADSAVVAFRPRVAFTDTAVVELDVVVRSRGVGLAAMRAATSRAGLAAAPWIDNPRTPAALDSIDIAFLLPPGFAPVRFFAENRSDFGFTRIDSLLAIPRAVAPAGITLDGGAATTPDPEIVITASARYATEMRFSESPDFTGVPWRPFAIVSTFTLSPAPGAKTVYAVFRNGVDGVGRAASASITLLGGAPHD
jgi:hypothetical protein